MSGGDFFLISCSDGDTCIHRFATEAEALEYLPVNEETGDLRAQPIGPGEDFETDPNYWGNRFLIVRGTVVTPQPVSVKYELR